MTNQPADQQSLQPSQPSNHTVKPDQPGGLATGETKLKIHFLGWRNYSFCGIMLWDHSSAMTGETLPWTEDKTRVTCSNCIRCFPPEESQKLRRQLAEKMQPIGGGGLQT
jgi:hypothetical protein